MAPNMERLAKQGHVSALKKIHTKLLVLEIDLNLFMPQDIYILRLRIVFNGATQNVQWGVCILPALVGNTIVSPTRIAISIDFSILWKYADSITINSKNWQSSKTWQGIRIQHTSRLPTGRRWNLVLLRFTSHDILLQQTDKTVISANTWWER